jgi:hypothetical protein
MFISIMCETSPSTNSDHVHLQDLNSQAYLASRAAIVDYIFKTSVRYVCELGRMLDRQYCQEMKLRIVTHQ